MGNHALLSASSSHRWLNCPPSARLCEGYDDKGSDFAAEGSDAHSLCEFKLRKVLGMEAEDPTEDLTWYDAEMDEAADGYVTFVMELLAEAKKTCSDPVVLIEQRLDYSKYVQAGFGTGDCVLIADGTLHIVDFKHGRGVLVEADDNPQMKLYALGALKIFDCLYDIDTVSMTIYQPRRANVSTFTRQELLDWAETVLVPTAELAFAGDGEYHCGEWCQFCKAKADCRERARANMELARYEFRQPPLLTDEEVEEILGQLDSLMDWASDIKDYALQAAISGKHWSGYKLVEGRANRRYTNENAVVAAVKAAGYDPYDEPKLLGVTAMTTLLGRKQFNDILGGLITKPQGKPTFVPESDKRPAITTIIDDLRRKTDMSNNAKLANPMKVITGKDTRWSYANVWEAKSINGRTPKFSVSLIVPKSDTVTVEKIKAAIQAAYEEGQAKLKGNGRSVPPLTAIKTPLRDGDTERPDNPAYANAYFINANSATAPGIVDADCNPILSRSEVYSGVYGRASISFYAFNSNGNKGIACGLNNLQKIRDGEPLGGKASATSDFASDGDVDDFLD